MAELRMPWLPRWRAWPVKVPVNFVAVYQGAPHVNSVTAINADVAEAVAWYRRQKIALVPRLTGLALDQREYNRLLHRPVFGPMETHKFRTDGTVTVLYLINESWWKGKAFGEAFVGPVAVVAGNRHQSAKTLIHELGHMLLSPDEPTADDHQLETFMDTQIGRSPMRATVEQRTRMYENAWARGSL